jgi:pimeloyl-ACP methyl ester carboxylesterase
MRARDTPLSTLLSSIVIASFASGCLETRIVSLPNVDLDPQVRTTSSGWKASIARDLDIYQSSPVLTAGDERLEPIYGGISTLTYFGIDLQQKARDQLIARRPEPVGRSLSAACEVGEAQAIPLSSSNHATIEVPAYEPVWMPIDVAGGAAAAGVGCDSAGRPISPTPGGHFCMFGRMALQTKQPSDLIVVLHGLFDSSAQDYVQRLGAALYNLGHSVLLADMRDHGETYRAAPHIATTLGTVEGRDVLAVAAALRAACSNRISRIGVVGVSGGGLDAIRSFIDDKDDTLDAGVLALSPLLDVDAAVRDVSDVGPCPITNTIELTLPDELGIAGLTGLAAGIGALVAQLAEQNHRVRVWPIAAGAGAGMGSGLLLGLAADVWLDGGASPCFSQRSIGSMFGDMLEMRWRELLGRSDPLTGQSDPRMMSSAGRDIDPANVTLDDYVHERVEYLARLLGTGFQRYDALTLANQLRQRTQSKTSAGARLLVIGTRDDPVTREPALRTLRTRTANIDQIYVSSVQYGGHGAMWVVQPTAMERVFSDFFGTVARDAGTP